MDPLYTAKPSDNGINWNVWNMREPLPPKPVFVGTMEEAGFVADSLNRIAERQSREPHLASRVDGPKAND